MTESTKRILLVEDEVITAMLMRRQLMRLGLAVIEHVTTGEDAVIQAEQLRPDVILMDIQLAGEMDGIEASQRIRENVKIPVIFVTGYENPSVRERAQATRPLGYLIKPFDEMELLTLIAKIPHN